MWSPLWDNGAMGPCGGPKCRRRARWHSDSHHAAANGEDWVASGCWTGNCATGRWRRAL